VLAARTCWHPPARACRDAQVGWTRDNVAARIRQIIAADNWYAVFARTGGPGRDFSSSVGARPSAAVGAHRASGPVPEFVPLVAWALVVDESGIERIVGVLVHDDLAPELVLTDDPSFLGYAGPGDPGVDRAGLTPDWRALAKQAIAELRTSRRRP
jgi:hypothetical protein